MTHPVPTRRSAELWQFASQLQHTGLSAIWNRRGDGTMGVFSALDLVIAMPVSWLPLVADYARHGKSGRGALGGTWLGYTIANIWCYALGVIVVSVAHPGDRQGVGRGKSV